MAFILAARSYGLVFPGDSFTNGTGASSYNTRYPTLVANSFSRPRSFVNAGIGGETSSQILTRVQAFSANYKTATQVIWAGRNNYTDTVQVKADIAAMIAAVGHSRFLVLGILPNSGQTAPDLATLTQLNADLATTYGAQFIPTLAPLQAANNGSVQDLADVAAGYTPTSLRSDALHLNDAGYAVIAPLVYALLATYGW